MARDLFQREATTLGKIGSHPQIPTLLDYFEDSTEFYLVQDFIQGLTLHQEVKKEGPFSELAVKQMLTELLPVIEYVHQQQVIHRDIKPANIIRRAQDKKLVLIDFGAVKDQVNPLAAAASEHTALTSYAIGTPGYAPPEQMAMRPVYGSDIYAMGVTCVYLLTGRSPKDLNYNPATGEMMWEHYVDISSNFIEILKKMMEVSVRHRYQSAQEVAQVMNLEPYHASLSDSLMNKRPPRPSDNRSSAPNTGGKASPFFDIAEDIRRRKQESLRKLPQRPDRDVTQVRQTTTFGRPGSTLSSRNGNATGGLSTGGGPRSQNSRLSPQDLQKRYERGDRDFATCDLRSAQMQRFVLSGGNFHEARFAKANLQGADLSAAHLSHTSFNQAQLKDARLTKAYLSHADFQDADLRGADLTGAYLSNANLRGANLAGANLTKATVTDEQLSLAKLSWNTVFPNGKRGGIW
jgi:serine/threonine protein kinase, bacterial